MVHRPITGGNLLDMDNTNIDNSYATVHKGTDPDENEAKDIKIELDNETPIPINIE